jgi:DNA invertase Pin-like site-specific DNA recombinase
MATYGYARASTKKQSDSPETQSVNIGNYAALNHLGDVIFFVDPAKSGKAPWEKREAGGDLFSRLKPGDNVIVAKLDRAFRKLSDCVVVLENFERVGIKLHICNMLGGAIDLSSPMGRFLIHILAAFAELERAFISERTRDGLANKKRKGIRHARFPGYGFRWEKRVIDGKSQRVRVPDDQEREVMNSIVQWRKGDPPLSWDEISQRLRRILNLKTKEGREWDVNRVRRAYRAESELKIQELREQRQLADNDE